MPQRRKEVFVRDPIHGLIRLDSIPVVKDLVDMSVFQRLRRIQQLGFSSMTYPSATHTRFSHSIGTMNVFRRILNHLMENEDLSPARKTELLKLGCATALLHDIGHGPFSHVSEKPLNFKHETISKQLLDHSEVAEVLDRHHVKRLRIARIISGTVTRFEALIRQFVSSQLDADRLDYLMRDAYFAGVGFGNIDLDRMVNIFEVFHGRSELNGYAVGLGKSRYTIESYIITRHMMYQEVYYHKTTRGCEVLFRKIIDRARMLNERRLRLPPELEFIREPNQVTWEDILPLDDVVVTSAIRQWSKSNDMILADLCKRLLERRLLKAIELTRDEHIEYAEGLNARIDQIVREAGLDPQYYVGIDHSSETPYEPYPLTSPEDRRSPISNVFIYNQRGIPEDVSVHSEVLRALPRHYNDRLFVPKELVGPCNAVIHRD